jgi:hypothetical protein
MGVWDRAPPDLAMIASLSGSLIAAAGNLDMVNIESRAERIRRGGLSRC